MIKTLLLLLLLAPLGHANNTCSRVAVIENKEVLIDASPRAKAEGLRYYLARDEKSLALLNKYQKLNRPSTYLKAASTTGSLLFLAGVINSSSQDRSKMMIIGSSMALVSYLFTKTKSLNNERYLDQAIKEYNQRNTPKIHFSPFKNNNESGINIGMSMEY